MFKNHEFRVRMVKTTTPPAAPTPDVTRMQITPEQLSQIAKEQMQHAAILVGAAYTTKVVLDTASRIALIVARAKMS